ncbi:MAG: hypothetical protein BGO90_15060 [Legionella sp. 40-6]|nr:MAG: hypothetical protein BGO90_15060 [Legionella sp. 40-6]
MIIYYLANLITQDEINDHKVLIIKILANELHTPQIKRLTGITFQGQPVYRAKIDKKNRLIFMRILHAGTPALLILSQNDHNYEELARTLSTTQALKIESLELDSAPVLSPSPTPEERFLPVTFYQEQVFFLDEDQQQATNCTAPLLLSGPPGAGKTLVIYDLLCNYVVNNAQQHRTRDELGQGQKILFISQSANLTRKIQQQYAQDREQDLHIDFLTWEQLLLPPNTEHTLLPKKAFADWLKNSFPQGNAEVIHYEMSLVAALGAEAYLKLGKRECYLFGKTKEQQKVINLLAQWRNHLQTKKWRDPLITEITVSGYGAIFCDESQNFSPIALACLVQAVRSSQQFFACLDPEQALSSWPYARNCLLNLLTKQFKNYHSFNLKKTWRCASKIAEVANHLMNTKHKLDGNQAKREYSVLESHLSSESGVVEIIHSKQLELLRPRGNLAETVIIVFTPLTVEERAKIQEATGSSNILTPAEAIGLDFNTVILWKPIASQRLLHKLTYKKNGLDLDEWKTLNQLYVAITRARHELFIYEPELNRFNQQLNLLFRNIHTAKNITEAAPDTDTENKRKWLEQVDYHIEKGQLDIATAILKNHLQFDEEAILARISPPALPTVEDAPKNEITPRPPKVFKVRNREKAVPESSKTAPKKQKPSLTQPKVKVQSSIELPELQRVRALEDFFESIVTSENQNIYFNKYMINKDSKIRTAFKDILIKKWGKIYHKQLFHSLFGNNLLYEFARYPESRFVLHRLFYHLNPVEQSILLKAMLPVINQDGSVIYDSPFLLFCESEDGCEHLKSFFEVNSELLHLLQMEHLDNPSPLQTQARTPLRILVKSCASHSLLEQFFSSPRLVQAMQQHHFYLGYEGKERMEHAPFFYLITYSTGVNILESIYKTNPALAQRTSAHPPLYFLDYLFRIIPRGSITNSSPFFLLCTRFNGRLFIYSWFLASLYHASKHNPSKIDFVNTFTALIPNKHSAFADTSCIHYLCIDEIGHQILSIIQKSFPAIINKFTTVLLTHAGLDVGKIGGTTAIQVLSATKTGISLINQWLSDSEEFACALTASDFAQSQNVEYLSLFDNLCKTDEGCAVLYQWLQFNPRLMEALTYENRVAINSLNNSAEGKRVFELLKENGVVDRVLIEVEPRHTFFKAKPSFFENLNAQGVADPENKEDCSAKSMPQ